MVTENKKKSSKTAGRAINSLPCRLGVVVFCFFLVVQAVFCGTILREKTYREFKVRHEIRNGKVIDKSTVLLPIDKEFLQELRSIAFNQRKYKNQDWKRVLEIISATDSSAVVQEGLTYLCLFSNLPASFYKELHVLAFSNSPTIKIRLAYTLAWLGKPESIHTYLILLADSNQKVSFAATSMLCYFGIEVLSTLPFVPRRPFLGFDPLYMAKILKEISSVAFLGSGLTFTFSSDTAKVPPGFYLEAPNGGVIQLPIIQELAVPK